MSESFLGFRLRRALKYVLNTVMNEIPKEHLSLSAAVFSPHPDDETLGCGGTLIKKKRAGAEVNIFFMTDGRKSHPHLISWNELKSIRANEALAASRVLGVERNNVVFLDFEDGELHRNQNSAIHKTTEILRYYQPDEIFIPYYKEPALWAKDHFTTNRIVLSALQTHRRKINVYEYPIWFWYHWPWTRVPLYSPREFLHFSKNSLFSGLRLLSDFRCSVYIDDVLEIKRAALSQYKSQMTRLIPDPRWWTLGDISNGDFLKCFFQEQEIFRQYTLPE